MNKEKCDFTEEKLRSFILEMAILKGHKKPSTYLDEKLQQVKLFNDQEFECDFFLDIHFLCNQNADKFWSESHREDITKWLKSNAGGSGLITNLFDRTWEKVEQPGKDGVAIDTPNNTDSWQPLIKKELHGRINEIEAKIISKISKWQQGEDLIECAAFCQLLFDMNYFVKGCTCRKTVNIFSSKKYGTNIEIQLESSKRIDREVHKKLLKKYF